MESDRLTAQKGRIGPAKAKATPQPLTITARAIFATGNGAKCVRASAIAWAIAAFWA